MRPLFSVKLESYVVAYTTCFRAIFHTGIGPAFLTPHKSPSNRWTERIEKSNWKLKYTCSSKFHCRLSKGYLLSHVHKAYLICHEFPERGQNIYLGGHQGYILWLKPGQYLALQTLWEHENVCHPSTVPCRNQIRQSQTLKIWQSHKKQPWVKNNWQQPHNIR